MQNNDEQQQQRKKRQLEEQQPSLALPPPPTKPKRPLSAYNLFFRSERDRYIQEARRRESEEAASPSSPSSSSASRRGAVFRHLARHVATKWNDLLDEDKVQYEERAMGEKRRYNREMVAWQLKKMEYSMTTQQQPAQLGALPPLHQFEANLGFTLMEERLQEDIMIPPAVAAASSSGSLSLPQATSQTHQSQSGQCRVIHPNHALPPTFLSGDAEEKISSNCTTTSAPDCCRPPSLSGPSLSTSGPPPPFSKQDLFGDLGKITPAAPKKYYHYHEEGSNDAATGILKTSSSSVCCRPSRRDADKSRVASLEGKVPERASSPQGMAAAMSLASLKELKEAEGDGAFWMDPCVQSLVGSLLRDNNIEAGDSE